MPGSSEAKLGRVVEARVPVCKHWRRVPVYRDEARVLPCKHRWRVPRPRGAGSCWAMRSGIKIQDGDSSVSELTALRRGLDLAMAARTVSGSTD
jgi:hypothetical protein